MAGQLHEQRSALIEQRTALEAAHGELRRQFAELSDLKSYTDHILESLVTGIVTLDLDGRVVTLNDAAKSLLGCPGPSAARGRHVTQLLAHAPELVGILRAALQWRTARTATVTLHGPTGGVLPVEITTATLKGGEGQDLGVIVMVRDLTAVRALEAQLRHAQKMEAVGRLAGGVAHDFNNLLTVITGRSQLLLLKLPPESPLRRDVELVEETAHRASALTRQLLAFSRKQIVQPRVVDLNEVVRGMETMLSRLIGEDVDPRHPSRPGGGMRPGGPRPARADGRQPGGQRARRDAPRGTADARDRLRPARRRLRPAACGAPRRAPRAPGRSRHGRRDGRAHQGASLRAVLHDEGPGQGNRARAGDGLRHRDAERGLRSGSRASPDKGPAFIIDLPRVDAPADLRGDPGMGEAAPQGSETVLLVEDAPEVRGLARDILHQQGYTVLEAADGNEALRIGHEHGGPIHLLVTDVVMPQMGGRELADRLKAGRLETKILYVSGYTDDAILHQGALGHGHRLSPEALHGVSAGPQGPRGPGRGAGGRQPLAGHAGRIEAGHHLLAPSGSCTLRPRASVAPTPGAQRRPRGRFAAGVNRLVATPGNGTQRPATGWLRC